LVQLKHYRSSFRPALLPDGGTEKCCLLYVDLGSTEIFTKFDSWNEFFFDFVFCFRELPFRMQKSAGMERTEILVEDLANAPTRPPGRAAAAVGCAAVALALVSWSGLHRSTALLAQDGGAQFAHMCAVACAGRGGGVWGQGGSARTCAVCRLARKQARVQLLPGEGGVVQSLSGMDTVWSTVEDDEYGVSTPISLPAGGDDDKMVDGAGMTYFPEEFSGCLDHGDHDGFRNDRVLHSAPAPLSSSPFCTRSAFLFPRSRSPQRPQRRRRRRTGIAWHASGRRLRMWDWHACLRDAWGAWASLARGGGVLT
jgi:hypothetical protein